MIKGDLNVFRTRHQGGLDDAPEDAQDKKIYAVQYSILPFFIMNVCLFVNEHHNKLYTFYAK